MSTSVRSFARIVLLAACAACGTRQPVADVPAPERVRIPGDACPGPVAGANASVTSALGESSSPVVAFDGEAFALAWWDMRGKFPGINTIRVDRAGAPLSEFAPLPHRAAAKAHTIAVDGAATHVVWKDASAVMSIELAAGAEEPAAIAEQAGAAAAGAFGAVAWVEKGVLYFRNDAMLAPMPPTQVAAGGIDDVRIAWTGEQYAVVWSASVAGGRQILLQRLSNKGKRLGNRVKVSGTDGVSRNPEIAAGGGGFAVVWTNDTPRQDKKSDHYWTVFALVPERGDAPTAVRQLEIESATDRVAVAGAGAGGEYGIAWVAKKEPMGSAVYFARIGADGKQIGGPVRVSDDKPIACGTPALAFAGDGYGVAWHDDRSQTGTQIVFSFLGCGGAEAEAADAGAPPETPPAAEAKPEEPKLKEVFQ
jgi:hypothetical protein